MVLGSTITLNQIQTERQLTGIESNSLTLARDLIGQKHQSNTSTETRVSKVVSVDQHNVLIFTTLGLAAIASAMQEAAMFYTRTNGYFSKREQRIAHKAMAFIQGTGLDIALRIYGLDYDADSIRSNFFRTFHVNKA